MAAQNKLTPVQQKVCNLRISGMSMREALKKAGYSDSYADHHSLRFLKNPHVQNYIWQRQKDEAEVALADAVCVKKKLLQLMNDPDPKISLEAVKQLDAHNKWMEELKVKIVEATAKQSQSETSPEIIRFEIVQPHPPTTT